MVREIILSFDVEQDAPPYLHSFKGIEQGLPRILEVLSRNNVHGTFFTTGEVAEKFPDAVEAIVCDGHELGSHGYDHGRFDKMDTGEAQKNIQRSLDALRPFYNVISFRAPNLKFPEEYYEMLREEGIKYDSSQAVYKGWKGGVTRVNGVLVIPATATSIFFRLPFRLLKTIVERAKNPVVLFSHPWEYSGVNVWRPDLRINAGEYAVKRLDEFIQWAKKEGYVFRTLKEWGNQVEKSTLTPK
ncbi:MAG: polysaccharide deacetylase family protein [Candidatus Diapherotrites archaeon]|nr:polysaccharide deacetylase family protein [Candidatus Diapherotrites archaeon]